MLNKTLISILNYNGTEDTIECLKSFYQFEKIQEYFIVIWDNASDYAEIQKLERYIETLNIKTVILNEAEYSSSRGLEYDLALVKSDKNYGFAAANNRVVEPYVGCFPYYILLNNDTVFRENTTSKCIRCMDKDCRIGVLTSSIYYYSEEQKIWNAGGKFIYGWRKYYTEQKVKKLLGKGIHIIKVDYITGCYMIIRNDILKQYGLFTEKFFFGEEDYNYCMRLQKNNVNLCVRIDLGLYHKVGASVSRNADLDKILRNAFVHYLNRYIDMRDFYSDMKWKIWSIISSILCFRTALKITRFNIPRSIRFVLKIFECSVNNCVDKEYFEKIMNGEII